ncbi:neurotrypsin [Gadus chalcogrammus]|uniref:neurotrypsin n=1 Tax=Gadus chalcogrammus TaxID=1042646 RepID=UPI0024C37250|nr:neurotrypsin [Gadus chalcogrammus]
MNMSSRSGNMELTFVTIAFALLAMNGRVFSNVHSFIPPFTDCVQSRGGKEGSYQGAIDVTESGSRCMNWSQVAGFKDRYQGKGVGDHNHCRNPDGRIRPWCFFNNTRGRVDWGYCDCKQGSVRLLGGRSKLDGRVEVYLRGIWGSICSQDWADEDAAVVCRQLGKGFTGQARTTALSLLGVARLHWGAVHCQGAEPDLLQCPRTPWNGGECPMAAAVTCSQQQVVVPVRLVGGVSGSEGRVEVFHGGQWGSVCDDQWDDRDAEVVCRQLGLSGIPRAWGQARFGEGSGRMWLDEVRCTGNELSLEQCPKASWGDHDCLHSEDAGVSCHTLPDGTVRLAGGTESHEGRLEIFYRGQWGTVCDDGWTDSNTLVVCRQLGYRSGTRVVSEEEGEETPGTRFGWGSGPILLDDVSCTGKEPGLELCQRREWTLHDCTHYEDVSVACGPQRPGPQSPGTQRPGPDPHTSVAVRLVGGETPREGRVEVFMSGTWGTVCDDGWTDRGAAVVCRQLGFSGEAKARVMAYFGEGSGPIHVDNVKCSGEERSLADCVKRAPGTHNCRHSEDAGVICDYGQSQLSSKEVKAAPDAVCGLRLVHSRQRRVIGGENSLRGGWPWQAAVRLRGSRGDGRLVCGATLIHTCWVLTSAHCFKRYGNSTRQYKVRLGDYHALVPEEHEEEYGVELIVLHPAYRPHSNDHDLALVRLAPGAPGRQPGECAPLGRHVRPACLPHAKERVLKSASNCYITGWGDTGRSYSKTLQQASVSLLPRRRCQERFHEAFAAGRMLCAGSERSDRRVDSCRGDSGGPLVCERRGGGGWALYGVTSWGHACRAQASPGVYTKVSAFTSWIHKVIGRYGGKKKKKL